MFDTILDKLNGSVMSDILDYLGGRELAMRPDMCLVFQAAIVVAEPTPG